MAERARSHDHRRETEEVLGVPPEEIDTPSAEGREGGEIQRKVGTRDELKRVTERGQTAPKAQDQSGSGDKEGV
ncbi:hypothetical protein ACX9MO_19515 [Pseudooceanicola sp. 502str34]